MAKMFYCAECAETPGWSTEGDTTLTRCRICGKSKECYSEETHKMQSKKKGPLIVTDVEDAPAGSKPTQNKKAKGKKRGRKPARLTAEAARKRREKKLATAISETVDIVLSEVENNVEQGEVSVVLPKEIAESHDMSAKINKTLDDLGYDVDVSEGQVRIKW